MKTCFACQGRGVLSSSNCQACGKRAHPTPCCGSCRMRHDVPSIHSTVVVADISKATMNDLYRLAHEFDASTREEHAKDPSKPTHWTAIEFVEWLRPSTTDYHTSHIRDYDGIQGMSDSGIPMVLLPRLGDPRAIPAEGNDDARRSMVMSPQASLRDGEDRKASSG